MLGFQTAAHYARRWTRRGRASRAPSASPATKSSAHTPYLRGSFFKHDGFIYDGSTFSPLEYPGATYTEADAIDGNTVVGTWYRGGSANRGFIYNGNTFTPLDVPGGAVTIVTGVSGSTVVGYSEGRGFIYNGSTFTFLDAPGAPGGEGKGTFIGGVSGGTVVGWTGTSTGGHGFIYDGSAFTTLDYPGAFFTRLWAISGNIVVGDEDGRGFFYDGSAFTALNVPIGGNTSPHGISGNTVVGSYFDQFARTHGFIVQIPEPASAMLVAIVGLGLRARRPRLTMCGGMPHASS
jgi:hypothetical protein